nr:hypothetical protein [Methylobacterium nodulans]
MIEHRRTKPRRDSMEIPRELVREIDRAVEASCGFRRKALLEPRERKLENSDPLACLIVQLTGQTNPFFLPDACRALESRGAILAKHVDDSRHLPKLPAQAFSLPEQALGRESHARTGAHAGRSDRTGRSMLLPARGRHGSRPAREVSRVILHMIFCNQLSCDSDATTARR